VLCGARALGLLWSVLGLLDARDGRGIDVRVGGFATVKGTSFIIFKLGLYEDFTSVLTASI
jgi:hypothetical protein